MIETLAALSEPNRLRIVELLRAGPHGVNDISEHLSLRQPQVSKHLRVLREVDVVSVRENGRQRLYRLNGVALKPIHDWVKAHERLWGDRFDELDLVLEDLKQKEDAGE
jgi:DNA-binding transcriptional ArsR family regulator